MAYNFLLSPLAKAFVILWVIIPLLYQACGNAFDEKKPNQEGGCDASLGNWVIDDFNYPLYNASADCPFIVKGFDCLRNGRPDHGYLKYKWKPIGCHLPRFDGQKFLERNRGKKIMFVGDSISNNMWQSLTCLLHIAVPESNYIITTQRKNLLAFLFPEYEASIMWLKNGFLVDVVRDKEKGRIIKLDSIETGFLWKDVDVLIFNTYHWWTHIGQSEKWAYVQIGDKIIEGMDYKEAYKIGLTTWANWIDSNIDQSKIKVLFQGIAASHSGGVNCVEQTQPEQELEAPHPGLDIAKSILSNMTNPVDLLDITLLTQLRIDGHPSIYSGRGTSYVDCSHWCLAGVPDTWNEILYATLIQN